MTLQNLHNCDVVLSVVARGLLGLTQPLRPMVTDVDRLDRVTTEDLSPGPCEWRHG